MADDKDKGKKEEGKSGGKETVDIRQSFADWAVHQTMQSVLPWVFNRGRTMVEERIATAASRKRNKHYYAAAMVQLRLRDRRAADIIGDFNDNYLDNDTDREDFQHNAACVGTDTDEKMPDTVEFLWQLAQLPDHPARELHLTALGFMGARSVDMAEKAAALLKGLRTTIKGLPAHATRAIDAGVQTLKDFDGNQLQKVETSSAATHQASSDWLAGLKTRLGR